MKICRAYLPDFVLPIAPFSFIMQKGTGFLQKKFRQNRFIYFYK